VNRFPFLDWMRGLALVIMIQVHVFNSFARTDVRNGGVYSLAVFAGGMAGPLFLFMAGMTFAFQMDRLEHKEPRAGLRWLACLRRAGYIFAIAYLIRLTDWVGSWGHTGWSEILRVDILNSMGLAMAAFSLAAFATDGRRIRWVLAAAVFIAAVSPLVANWNWEHVPDVVRQYLQAGYGRGHFPFFPCASYLGFGMTAGAAVRLTEAARMDRLMHWAALIGGGSILAGQYVSNLPYAVYPKSNFWTDSPTLIAIRVGVSLVMLAGCYTWTAYCAGSEWSWMQCLGRNSLMVYWVHLILVYGPLTAALQKALSIPATVLATLAVIAAMVAMSALWQWWKQRRVAARPAAVQGNAVPPRS
jgi:predicted acyltransferase